MKQNSTSDLFEFFLPVNNNVSLLVPGYISRSVAGSYDNEGIAIFALQFTYFLWVSFITFCMGSISPRLEQF